MITIRHIDRTCLNHNAFISMVKSYSKLDHDILIVFDDRISCMGMHIYEHTKKLHTIRLSPKHNKYGRNELGEPVRLDAEAEKHNLISTVLHELHHGTQREKLKQSFFRKDYLFSKSIKNPDLAEHYSKSELEARRYECENILKAVEFYDKHLV